MRYLEVPFLYLYLLPPLQIDDPLNTALAGFVGGGIMFGRNDPVTSQINMYIMSRVIFGLCRTAANAKLVTYQPWMFTLFGAAAWGLVMYLYYHQDKVLQGSMIASMNFIYGDTDNAPLTSLWRLITEGVAGK
jgi:peroxisomal membrane protein 4